MNMWHTRGKGSLQSAVAILGSVVGLGVMTHSASASLINLTAGNTVTFSVGQSTALPGGSPVTVTNNILNQSNTGPAVLGTLTSSVYVDGNNNDEFVYSVTVAPNAGDNFDAVTLADFVTGITTAVGYNNPGGTVDPTSATRNLSNEIDWAFTSNGTLGPGQTSDYLIVDTNTQSYTTGAGFVEDDIVGAAPIEIPLLMPNVPEPASAGLIAVVGGLLLGRRRRA